MSRLFPHADYAEDQPLHRTILATHVAARAATTGTLAGAAVLGARALLPKRAATPTTKTAATAPTAAALRLLRASGSGVAWATALAGLYLGASMARWEPIESQDRAWRLMENQGQLETDDWTVAGTAAGVVAATAVASSGGGFRAGVRLLGWRGLLGAAGSGSVIGMVGYLGWRYGIKKGQREAVAL
ncbi:hypothetical protein RB594_008216 [Gaeumannomyces avenae]